MKTFNAFFILLFVITSVSAYTSEIILQEELSGRYIRNTKHLQPQNEMNIRNINEVEKDFQKYLPEEFKKKGDELQSNKYLPSVVEILGSNGFVRRCTFTYDEQGKNGTMFDQESYENTGEWITTRYWKYTYDEQQNQLSRKEYTSDIVTPPDRLINSWTYTYDENGKILTEEQDRELVGRFRATFTYDDKGNKLTHLIEMFYNQKWIKYRLLTYSYDRKGNLFPVSSQCWEYDELAYYYRTTYTYNQQENFLTGLKDYFRDGQWVNYERYSWTYDLRGNMMTKIIESWDNEKWIIDKRYSWTYDLQGNMLTEIRESWDNEKWINAKRYSWTYDLQGNMLTELRSYEKNGQWDDSYRITFTYDNLGNMLSRLSEMVFQEQWGFLERWTYTFDIQGNMTSGIWEEFNSNTSTWQPYLADFNLQNVGIFYCSSIKITWTSILDVEESAQNNTLQISPNPASENIMLMLPEGISTGELHISNSLGELVKTINLTGEARNCRIDISTSELPDGLYFCSIVSGQHRLSKSFVIVR